MIPRYLQVGFWMIGDALRLAPIAISLILGLGVVGASLQASLLLTLNWSANELVSPGDISVPIFDLQVSKQAALYAVSIAIVVQAGGAAILTYIANTSILGVCRRYQLHLSERILSAIGDGVTEGRIDPSGAIKQHRVSGLIDTLGTRVAILLRRLILSCSSVIKFLIFLALSFYVHAGVALFLIGWSSVILSISVLFFARSSSRNARRLPDARKAARRQWLQLTESTASGERHSLPESSLREQPIGVFQRTFQSRILNKERSRLAALLAMVVLIASTLVAFGGEVIADTSAWPQLALAIIAVFMTMLALSEIASQISIFGNFFPFVESYHSLHKALKKSTNDEQLAVRLERIHATMGRKGSGDGDIDLEEF